MIRVILVDDHAIVREGLKRIIGENSEMSVVGEAEDGNEALTCVRTVACDVVLLDIALPRKNGLDVLKELHAEKPQIPILVLSSHAEDQLAVRCLRSGAAGYLNKGTVLTEVVHAIRKVARGGKYVSGGLAKRVVFNLHSEARLSHHDLSDREYQVVCMIGSGKTVGQIAEELALSVKTVSTYRVRILSNLNLETNSDIITYAIKEGLVD